MRLIGEHREYLTWSLSFYRLFTSPFGFPGAAPASTQSVSPLKNCLTAIKSILWQRRTAHYS